MRSRWSEIEGFNHRVERRYRKTDEHSKSSEMHNEIWCLLFLLSFLWKLLVSLSPSKSRVIKFFAANVKNGTKGKLFFFWQNFKVNFWLKTEDNEGLSVFLKSNKDAAPNCLFHSICLITILSLRYRVSRCTFEFLERQILLFFSTNFAPGNIKFSLSFWSSSHC